MSLFFKEAFGYLLASACALVVDISALWALVHFLSLGYLTAATISFMLGAVVAYELSVKLAFENHRLRSRRNELMLFVLVGAIGLAVNAVVIAVAVSRLGLYYLTAKCIAAAFTFSCNFLVRRQLLFVLPADKLSERCL